MQLLIGSAGVESAMFDMPNIDRPNRLTPPSPDVVPAPDTPVVPSAPAPGPSNEQGQGYTRAEFTRSENVARHLYNLAANPPSDGSKQPAADTQAGQPPDETPNPIGQRQPDQVAKAESVPGGAMAQPEAGYQDRLAIPPELKDWSADWPDYDPPGFTTEWVRTTGVEIGQSDPESPSEVDYSQRPSFMGEYTFDEHQRPQNPQGRQGLADRGDLAKWGPNNAADPVVVATDPETEQRKILLIRREDSDNWTAPGGNWALPGGMVDPGEHVSRTAVRELLEEAGIDLRHVEGEVIYEGYVNDPRNTDNAWIETTARLFGISYTPQPTAGSDAAEARWFSCNTIDELLTEIQELNGLDPNTEPLYASHRQIVEAALRRA